MPAGWVGAGIAAAGAISGGIQSADAASSAKDAQRANAANVAAQNTGVNTALSKSEAIANTPFTPYTGTFAAPLSGNQQQAVNLASSSVSGGDAKNAIEQGIGQTNFEANNAWSPQTADKYMNPYTSSVVSNSIENANRSYLQNLGQLKEQSIGSGSFGGGRGAIQEGELAGQNQLNIGNLTATGYSNAYNAALNAWSSDNARAAEAAKGYEAAGNDITQMTGQQIQQLLQTGGAAQAVAQTNLNGAYQQYKDQQGWAANSLQPLLQATGKGAIAQQPAVQSNTANQLLGLGSTLAGLYGSATSGSGSSGADLSYGSTSQEGLNLPDTGYSSSGSTNAISAGFDPYGVNTPGQG